MSPKQDLEQRIRDSNRLINYSQQILQDSNDPTGREQSRANRNIAEQGEFLVASLKQYINLCKAMGYEMEQDIKEMAVTRGFELP